MATVNDVIKKLNALERKMDKYYSSLSALISAPPSFTSVSIPLIFYGWFNEADIAGIIQSNPKYLVANSPAGAWRGNADIKRFPGIKYFEYLDGGYEGSLKGEIPNDLISNLLCINATAEAGGYGIFLDQVTAYPTSQSLSYLKGIHDKAQSLNLKVVFNCGVSSWSPSLMDYCDYICSSETWHNEALTPSQETYKERVWLLTQGVTSGSEGATLTKSAWNKGIDGHYACNQYTVLPTWFASYISQIK